MHYNFWQTKGLSEISTLQLLADNRLSAGSTTRLLVDWEVRQQEVSTHSSAAYNRSSSDGTGLIPNTISITLAEEESGQVDNKEEKEKTCVDFTT